MANDAATYPVLGAHFKVHFHGLESTSVDVAFQSVSGLTATIETETMSSGGSNNNDFTLPTKVSYANLVLKRGLKKFPSALTDWCENAFENFRFQPVDIVIVLMDEKHEPIMSWYISKAIPIKYEMGEMNAEAMAIMVETFELKYEKFKINE